MLEQDRKKFALLVDSLAANFGKPAEEALLEAYWRALRDLPIESVERAVDAALRQCQHMPRGVELRELCGDMATETRAALAWEALRKAIGAHGSYRSVDFDDKVINATVRNLGGWQRLCAIGGEEFDKWTRKDFERIYLALVASGVTEEQIKHLPGVHEQANAASAYAIAAPAVVVTGLPAHREGVIRAALGPRKYEGNVPQLEGLVRLKAMP